MTIGRIGGPMLKENLIRQGVDLSFETDLLYLDVNNMRVGINTQNPTVTADINGTARFSGNLQISGATISTFANNGNITIDPHGSGQVAIIGTNAVRIPAGGTSQRPAGVTGDFRLNTDTKSVEYYDGISWNTVGVSGGTSYMDLFVGDDSTVSFTLTQAGTTAGSFVTVNGLVQNPNEAYTITGTTLTFTEPPPYGNLIYIRNLGANGATGYTGSQGISGYAGSRGVDGYAGSSGYAGSVGSRGYTGSIGVGYTGSVGFVGSRGFTGSAGVGYTGSVGGLGYTGSSVSATTLSAYVGNPANTVATGWQKVPIDTLEYDPEGTWSYIEQNIVPTKEGFYLFTGRVKTDTDNVISVAIAKNGVIEKVLGTNVTSAVKSHGGSVILYANGTTDYFELYVYCTAIGALSTDLTETYLQMNGPLRAGATGYTGSTSVGYTGSTRTGFTGSASTAPGYTGSIGFSGSRGYTGSASTAPGYTGSLGYTGSIGSGYTGSASTVPGYTGSSGLGYSGSIGFTGSASNVQGYTGSSGLGYSGSIGFTGSKGVDGYAGSRGIDGYAGSAGTQGPLGYTGSAGGGGTGNGYTGSIGFTGSKGIDGYAGSRGYTGSLGYTGSAIVGYTGSAGTGAANANVNDNTTTNATYYPVFVANVGVNSTLEASSTKLTFNPSTGAFSAISKSFLIDHPTKSGMKLHYGSLESPYHGVRLTGKDTLTERMYKVELPDYIKDLCKAEGATVQLTNIKHSNVMWIYELNVDENYFIIGCDEVDVEFYWSFTAIRKDIPDLEVEYYGD